MLTPSYLFRASLVFLVVSLLCVRVSAGGPVFWEISKYDDVIKGDARGVSIANDGTITLAPAYTLVFDTNEGYIWSSATDASGNVYLGTGHEGRVFKVNPAGAGKLLYDAAELDVTALATDPQGNLYAGTSPDGKIYKITPDGRDSVLYDPPDKYIWSLAFDQSASALYAGTGDKGVIYRIDRSGKASVLADTNETNIVSLAVEKNGGLLAGTDPSGLVLRVSPEGKTFALFDSPTQEIHSLALAPDGSVFALGVNEKTAAQKQTLGIGSVTTSSGDTVITLSTDDQDSPSQPQAQESSLGQTRNRNSADGSKGALFRLLPDGGGSEVLWRSNDTIAFALRPLADGRVMIGTGNRGRIYAIARDRSHTLVVQSPEDQTSTIVAVGDSLFATSSNLGRLYRISNQSVAEGVYTSSVRDTRFAGQWGVVTWRGSGNIELQTRTGNTESPDSTWSDWSAPYRAPTGDQITSPGARFIQFRATLRSAAQRAEDGLRMGASAGSGPGAAPTAGSAIKLKSIVIAYLPRNQAPEIAAITVLPPGVALQEMPLAIDPSIASSGLDPQLFGVALSVPPRRFFQKGARTLTWQASDPNDETLRYKVQYRAFSDTEWHTLGENLSESYYTIDGNKLPDGSYVFRVVASDAPGNPSEQALSDEETTDPVEIDNTPPTINTGEPRMNGGSIDVTFDVRDSTSRVIKAEYSLDGGSWQLIFPIDGIADSANEVFKVRARFERSGEHVVAFRCSDSSSNVGTAKVIVTR